VACLKEFPGIRLDRLRKDTKSLWQCSWGIGCGICPLGPLSLLPDTTRLDSVKTDHHSHSVRSFRFPVCLHQPFSCALILCINTLGARYPSRPLVPHGQQWLTNVTAMYAYSLLAYFITKSKVASGLNQVPCLTKYHNMKKYG
jgi:hypothetical protein